MPDRDAHDAYDDERLIRYLVGSLGVDETDRLDELSITNDALAARLREVEDDLVDAWVRGELSADIRDRFESLYLSTPARRDKVRFAEALLARQNQTTAAGSRPATLGGGHERRRLVPQWAMVAAAMLVVAAGSYALVELTRVQAPPQPAENLRAAPTLPAPVPAAPAPPRPEARRPDAPVLSFVLLPPTRGISEPPTFAVRSESAKVEVRVVLESNDFLRYQVVLKDPGTDRIIWRSARLSATLAGGNRIVPVTLDTSLLGPQRYVLDLTGFPVTGEAQLVASYPFRLALR